MVTLVYYIILSSCSVISSFSPFLFSVRTPPKHQNSPFRPPPGDEVTATPPHHHDKHHQPQLSQQHTHTPHPSAPAASELNKVQILQVSKVGLDVLHLCKPKGYLQSLYYVSISILPFHNVLKHAWLHMELERLSGLFLFIYKKN